MKVLTIILLMIIAVLVLTSVSTLIYMIYFRHALNKRISQGNTAAGKHDLMEPLKFFLLAFLVLTLLGFVFLMFTGFDSKTDGGRSVVFEKCDESPLSLISPDDDIPGYKKSEKNEGGFEVVWYVKDSENESFPDILIHIGAEEEYTYTFSSDMSDLVLTGKSDEKNGWYSAVISEGNVDLKIGDPSSPVTFTIER